MAIAQAIFHNDLAAIQHILENKIELVSDIDEYGFTPLIETVIMENLELATYFIQQGADVNQTDASGRSPLHWAVDNNNRQLCDLLLTHGADPNAYNQAGQSVLVYPVLRRQTMLRDYLREQGASLAFAQDFIQAKLLGHRYQLTGACDILNARGEFIEIDLEGFILEATVAIMSHSLQQFTMHYAARQVRPYFKHLTRVANAMSSASEALIYQDYKLNLYEHEPKLRALLSQPLIILPVAYAGHAMAFVKCGNYWAKCDRGAVSKKQGCVNIYKIQNPQAVTFAFLKNLLYEEQNERYVHDEINQELSLKPLVQLPFSSQLAGNCSWANVEASVGTAYFLSALTEKQKIRQLAWQGHISSAMKIHNYWLTWDQDRAVHEAVTAFEQSKSNARKATKVSLLAQVLFQACDYGHPKHMQRAEKIMEVLKQKPFDYVLRSYIKTYCQQPLTQRGNNLLHLLDDAGVPIDIDSQHPLPNWKESL